MGKKDKGHKVSFRITGVSQPQDVKQPRPRTTPTSSPVAARKTLAPGNFALAKNVLRLAGVVSPRKPQLTADSPRSVVKVAPLEGGSEGGPHETTPQKLRWKQHEDGGPASVRRGSFTGLRRDALQEAALTTAEKSSAEAAPSPSAAASKAKAPRASVKDRLTAVALPAAQQDTHGAPLQASASISLPQEAAPGTGKQRRSVKQRLSFPGGASPGTAALLSPRDDAPGSSAEPSEAPKSGGRQKRAPILWKPAPGATDDAAPSDEVQAAALPRGSKEGKNQRQQQQTQQQRRRQEEEGKQPEPTEAAASREAGPVSAREAAAGGAAAGLPKAAARESSASASGPSCLSASTTAPAVQLGDEGCAERGAPEAGAGAHARGAAADSTTSAPRDHTSQGQAEGGAAERCSLMPDLPLPENRGRTRLEAVRQRREKSRSRSKRGVNEEFAAKEHRRGSGGGGGGGREADEPPDPVLLDRGSQKVPGGKQRPEEEPSKDAKVGPDAPGAKHRGGKEDRAGSSTDGGCSTRRMSPQRPREEPHHSSELSRRPYHGSGHRESSHQEENGRRGSRDSEMERLDGRRRSGGAPGPKEEENHHRSREHDNHAFDRHGSGGSSRKALATAVDRPRPRSRRSPERDRGFDRSRERERDREQHRYSHQQHHQQQRVGGASRDDEADRDRHRDSHRPDLHRDHGRSRKRDEDRHREGHQRHENRHLSDIGADRSGADRSGADRDRPRGRRSPDTNARSSRFDRRSHERDFRGGGEGGRRPRRSDDNARISTRGSQGEQSWMEVPGSLRRAAAEERTGREGIRDHGRDQERHPRGGRDGRSRSRSRGRRKTSRSMGRERRRTSRSRSRERKETIRSRRSRSSERKSRKGEGRRRSRGRSRDRGPPDAQGWRGSSPRSRSPSHAREEAAPVPEDPPPKATGRAEEPATAEEPRVGLRISLTRRPRAKLSREPLVADSAAEPRPVLAAAALEQPLQTRNPKLAALEDSCALAALQLEQWASDAPELWQKAWRVQRQGSAKPEHRGPASWIEVVWRMAVAEELSFEDWAWREDSEEGTGAGAAEELMRKRTLVDFCDNDEGPHGRLLRDLVELCALVKQREASDGAALPPPRVPREPPSGAAGGGGFLSWQLLGSERYGCPTKQEPGCTLVDVLKSSSGVPGALTVASAVIPGLRFPLSSAAGVSQAWEHSLEKVQGSLVSKCSQDLAPMLLFPASEEALWCEEEEAAARGGLSCPSPSASPRQEDAEHHRRKAQQEETRQKALESQRSSRDAGGDLVESVALEVLADLEAETEKEVGHRQPMDAAAVKGTVGLGTAPLPPHPLTAPQATPRRAAAADLPLPPAAPSEAPSRAAPEALDADRLPWEAPSEAVEGFPTVSGAEGIREGAKGEAAGGQEAPGVCSSATGQNSFADELLRAWAMLVERSAKQLAPLSVLLAGQEALAELRPQEAPEGISHGSPCPSVSPEKPSRGLASPSGGGREEDEEAEGAAACSLVADAPAELFEDELQGVVGMLALRSGKQLAPLLFSEAVEAVVAEFFEAPGSPSPKANGTALPVPPSLSSGGRSVKPCAERPAKAQRETERAKEKRAGADHGRGGGGAEAEERAKRPRREDGSALLKDLNRPLSNGSESVPRAEEQGAKGVPVSGPSPRRPEAAEVQFTWVDEDTGAARDDASAAPASDSEGLWWVTKGKRSEKRREDNGRQHQREQSAEAEAPKKRPRQPSDDGLLEAPLRFSNLTDLGRRKTAAPDRFTAAPSAAPGQSKHPGKHLARAVSPPLRPSAAPGKGETQQQRCPRCHKRSCNRTCEAKEGSRKPPPLPASSSKGKAAATGGVVGAGRSSSVPPGKAKQKSPAPAPAPASSGDAEAIAEFRWEDGGVPPEHLRCKRTSRNWRCRRLKLPGFNTCEKHCASSHTRMSAGGQASAPAPASKAKGDGGAPSGSAGGEGQGFKAAAPAKQQQQQQQRKPQAKPSSPDPLRAELESLKVGPLRKVEVPETAVKRLQGTLKREAVSLGKKWGCGRAAPLTHVREWKQRRADLSEELYEAEKAAERARRALATNGLGAAPRRPRWASPSQAETAPAKPANRRGTGLSRVKYNSIKAEFNPGRGMKNLKLARSGVHDWGLFAQEEIEDEEMVIEYVGELISLKQADLREQHYNAIGRDNYLFRMDDKFVVDATVMGGRARFINHSCDPNCYTRIIEKNGSKHICIYACRDIKHGEELCYDYKFEFEEGEDRVPCHCGSAICRGYLN